MVEASGKKCSNENVEITKKMKIVFLEALTPNLDNLRASQSSQFYHLNSYPSHSSPFTSIENVVRQSTPFTECGFSSSNKTDTCIRVGSSVLHPSHRELSCGDKNVNLNQQNSVSSIMKGSSSLRSPLSTITNDMKRSRENGVSSGTTTSQGTVSPQSVVMEPLSQLKKEKNVIQRSSIINEVRWNGSNQSIQVGRDVLASSTIVVELVEDPIVNSTEGSEFHHVLYEENEEQVDGHHPQFAQLYIYDIQNEISNKMKPFSGNDTNSNSNASLVEDLKCMIDEHNVQAESFRRVRDYLDQGQMLNVSLRLFKNRSRDARTYNLPSVEEVAALIVGDFDSLEVRKDIVCV